MTERVFLIGAPKCGTKTIAHWLDQMSSVCMSNPKEPHCFTHEFKQSWSNFIQHGHTYESLSTEAPQESVVFAEGSTHYLWSSDAVKNILQAYPDARFIVCLRNPVDMAISYHQHSLYWGNETKSSFEEAWAMQDNRIRHSDFPYWNPNPRSLVYRDVCATGSQVERLLNQVPYGRTHFVFLEDMKSDPEGVYRDLRIFLGVPYEKISLSSMNVTRGRRSVRLNFMLRKLKYHGGPKVWRKLLEIAGKINERFNTTNAPGRSLSKKFRNELVSEFEAEVRKLESATERDLSHWRASV